MNKKHVCVAAVILFSLVVFSAQADEAIRVNRAVFHGIFTSETGESADIRIPDGGSLAITNQDLGLFYKLTAALNGANQVELTVTSFTDALLTSSLETETLAIPIDGKAFSSHLMPFSLTFIGISQEQELLPAGSCNEKVSSKDQEITCCITCDGWRICCTPNPGYCCTVDYCGYSCTVCA